MSKSAGDNHDKGFVFNFAFDDPRGRTDCLLGFFPFFFFLKLKGMTNDRTNRQQFTKTFISDKRRHNFRTDSFVARLKATRKRRCSRIPSMPTCSRARKTTRRARKRKNNTKEASEIKEKDASRSDSSRNTTVEKDAEEKKEK